MNAKIKQKAKELGFDACGITSGEVSDTVKEAYIQWVKQDYGGEMLYLKENYDVRFDVTKIMEGGKSIIVVMLNYFPTSKQPHDLPQIAKYAYGKDYHTIMKKKLKQLLAYIQVENPSIKGRCFVDSAPILEKYWAQKAGLGWIGKNSLLINKELGSFFVIGEIIIDDELTPDDFLYPNLCGDCSRCMDACPTNAIIAPKIIDAKQCLSYHTIENKGEIPPEIKNKISNRLFGCDICQDACPWNQVAKPSDNELCRQPNEYTKFSLIDWQTITPEKFSEISQGLALKRAKYEGIMKNIFALSDNELHNSVAKSKKIV